VNIQTNREVDVMKSFVRSGLSAWCVALALVAPNAHAGLFDDDQARRAIIDLREKVTKLIEQQKIKDSEAVITQEQISQIKRSLLDLNGQLESALAEAAKLRGQNEQLMQDVAELQRTQKEGRPTASAGGASGSGKTDGQAVNMDGKEFQADPDEQRQFEEALAILRKGDFAKAVTQFSMFPKRFPTSGYNDSAVFWLGNAHYAKREYREAMSSFRTLVANAPTHQRAPEALLSVASCQAELRDTKAARRTLEELLRTYPKSEAAVAAKERLATLK
jgi:tol-pal system protein YbgF